MAWWKRADRSRPAAAPAPAADWRTDPRVARVVQLKERALELQTAGHFDQAADGFREGVALGRELVVAYAEPDHLEELAAMLYGLAAVLNMTGHPGEAMDALVESRRTYERLAEAGVENVAPLIADVRARLAGSMFLLGWATSAVVESDLALAVYYDLAAGPGGADYLCDLARVLGMNAEILAQSGDPELACASAEAAIRIFMENMAAFDGSGQPMAYLHGLTASCAVAGRIHAVHGRSEQALEADGIGVRLAEVMAELGGDAHRPRLAAAIARHGAHLVVAGQPGTGAARIRQARQVDAVAADEALAVVHDEQGERDRFGLSLGDALRRSVELGVDGAGEVFDLVDDTPGSAMVSPSRRCPAEQAPARAEALGRVGLATIRVSPREGTRICLEAHVMFALVSERGGYPPPFWAELLDELLEVLGLGAFGGDIVTWRDRIRQQAA